MTKDSVLYGFYNFGVNIGAQVAGIVIGTSFRYQVALVCISGGFGLISTALAQFIKSYFEYKKGRETAEADPLPSKTPQRMLD